MYVVEIKKGDIVVRKNVMTPQELGALIGRISHERPPVYDNLKILEEKPPYISYHSPRLKSRPKVRKLAPKTHCRLVKR